MLRSMTAYGRHDATTAMGTFSWELRAVNHRYLEFAFKLPERLRPIEPAAREQLNRQLKRGKVDVLLRFIPAEAHAAELTVNQSLVAQLLEASAALRTASADVAPVDPLRLLSWPGVTGRVEADDTELHASALASLQTALDDFVGAREREGVKTRDMLLERCNAVRAIVAQVREQRPRVIQRQQEKLRAKLADLDVTVDPGRVEQELVFAAQKLDIDEELDRLDAHVGEMHAIFERKEPVGRRLDFLMQEFNREANTLGSKAADADTTGFSVELKVLIEQMREQVQNVE